MTNDKTEIPRMQINNNRQRLTVSFGFRWFTITTYSMFQGSMLGADMQLDLKEAKKLRDFLTEWLEKCDDK